MENGDHQGPQNMGLFEHAFTGLTAQFFSKQQNQDQNQHDLSSQYLKSDISNQSKITHEIYASSIMKIIFLCEKQILRNAFHKVTSSLQENKKVEMSVEQRQLQIRKSMFKMQLLFYKTFRVRLELFFAKIVNASKQESTKTLLSKRSSINKLNQFLNCLETKSTFSNTQKCFDKIKKRWEICNKVQIFHSILHEIIDKYFTVKESFKKIKNTCKTAEKYFIGFSSLGVFEKNVLQHAFFLIRKKRVSRKSQENPSREINDIKPKLTPKFKRVKGKKSSQLLEGYRKLNNQNGFNRDSTNKQQNKNEPRVSLSPQNLRFSRLSKKKSNSSFKSSQGSLSLQNRISKTHTQGSRKAQQSTNIADIQFIKSFPKPCSQIQHQAILNNQEKWKCYEKAHILQYLRPQQFKEQVNDLEDLSFHLPLIFGEKIDRSRGCIECISVDKICFEKSRKMKRGPKENNRASQLAKERQGKVQTVTKAHYFPEQQGKQQLHFKAHRKQDQDKKGSKGKRKSVKKALEDTKSADRFKNNSPSSKITIFNKEKMSSSPTNKEQFSRKSKIQSFVPIQWRNITPHLVREQFTHHCVQMHRTPQSLPKYDPFITYTKKNPQA